MLHSDDSDELKAKRICCGCVGESYLSQEIDRTGDEAECSYCEETAQCWTVEDLADRIEIAFEHHFTRTYDQPTAWQQSLLSDRESDYEWERDGYPVLDAIEGAAEISRQAAEDVLAILDDRHSDLDLVAMGEETDFSPDSYYQETGPNSQVWHEEWRCFEESLKKEARFFSRTAAAHLASVFGDIDKLKTRKGRPVVVDAGPQFALNHLYRARVFQADEKLEEALCRPDLHLGPPPARLASAGRMNARGISVFYGATDACVAIAEVRPPVGSKAAVAKFVIIRPLRLLDLTALEDVHDRGSIFDPSLKNRLERAAFLHSLCLRITRPVMPDDEAFDYLATQAIADFLATENEPRLDGIIFQSAQSKEGRNVVLFHKAARIEAMEFPKGTEFTAYRGHGTEDGWETGYSVSELVPLPASPSPNEDADVFGFLSHPGHPPRWNDDFGEATLRVDPTSVEVHHIDWVQVQRTIYKVDRHRSEKRDWSF
ncbi:MAG: RES family NAD+ phosphorylase [Zoogloea sp.]|nr:RES family NAD+ phosphorylase [Zoogloea sp.]